MTTTSSGTIDDISLKNTQETRQMKKNKQPQKDNSKKEDTVRRTGTVTKVYGGTYEITDDATGLTVTCTLNGKMKMHSIRLIIGDKVEFEVSVYDLKKGRVVYRRK